MKKFSANFISVNIFKKDLIYLEFNVIRTYAIETEKVGERS